MKTTAITGSFQDDAAPSIGMLTTAEYISDGKKQLMITVWKPTTWMTVCLFMRKNLPIDKISMYESSTALSFRSTFKLEKSGATACHPQHAEKIVRISTAASVVQT
eukprot:CAMPEP_0195072074 /NCGR_PEP_ID=MMETSP0448-20130528/15740_1 /TAXON_ID=66468 /ORGANISM="Heterocapsa triquestra, Strain CCMP 448" /LENGTH=105 /DNA_ID=CAMNT_0040104013 /DNA_START=161 /DNA_END=474 /DNA_ORIENTATION=+